MRKPLSLSEAQQALRVAQILTELTRGRVSYRFNSHLEGIAASLSNAARRADDAVREFADA